MEIEKIVPYDEDADVNYETACFVMGSVISIYHSWKFVETYKETPDRKYIAELREKYGQIVRERKALRVKDRERVNLAIEKYSTLLKELRVDERYRKNSDLVDSIFKKICLN